MLSSYFYNEKILETAAMIISNDVVLQFKNLSGMRCKAFQVMNSNCARCETKISDKDKSNIAIFPCGHTYHEHCFENKDYCYACSHKEISNPLLLSNRGCFVGPDGDKGGCGGRRKGRRQEGEEQCAGEGHGRDEESGWKRHKGHL
eukprot:TRINITY_DN9983_c0_g1_i13.p2 TRINITY_DN9983_c0_g1~~TRINITY_DN9983_c0_g1_i13.p2  ORF type:complete len:146 (+),score=33.31 TRINITY_DN9983_c0_g1_i13:95-532(+)